MVPALARARLTLATCLVALFAATAALAGGNWNDTGIAWKGYEEGLAEAKSSGKPVMLVFYTEWCPHCTAYSKLFHDATLVETSKKFVMIRLDKDKNPAISGKYAPDGEYIPRTFFLKSDGTLLADVTEQRPKYKYFYNENDPQAVLRSMNAVLAMPAQS